MCLSTIFGVDENKKKCTSTSRLITLQCDVILQSPSNQSREYNLYFFVKFHMHVPFREVLFPPQLKAFGTRVGVGMRAVVLKLALMKPLGLGWQWKDVWWESIQSSLCFVFGLVCTVVCEGIKEEGDSWWKAKIPTSAFYILGTNESCHIALEWPIPAGMNTF